MNTQEAINITQDELEKYEQMLESGHTSGWQIQNTMFFDKALNKKEIDKIYNADSRLKNVWAVIGIVILFLIIWIYRLFFYY